MNQPRIPSGTPGPSLAHAYPRDSSGACWFFTAFAGNHRPILTLDATRRGLRQAITECRLRYPFRIDAWVLLPDHLHCVWTLPAGDHDHARRWSAIRRIATHWMNQAGGPGPPSWQPDYLAHRVGNDDDFAHHVEYVHFNPVRHGLAACVQEWPWSSFHRYVAAGIYPPDWGGLDLDLGRPVERTGSNERGQV